MHAVIQNTSQLSTAFVSTSLSGSKFRNVWSHCNISCLLAVCAISSNAAIGKNPGQNMLSTESSQREMQHFADTSDVATICNSPLREVPIDL